MCVIVASILWVYVMNEQNPITTRSFTVPLQTVHLQDDMLVKDLPETVNVRVSGTRSQIAALRTADVKAFIDFEIIKLETFQIDQRRVSGTKVINRNLKTLFMEPVKAGLYFIAIQHGALSHLQQ